MNQNTNSMTTANPCFGHRLLLGIVLGFLVLLNGYTLFHAVTDRITLLGGFVLLFLLLFGWKALTRLKDQTLNRIEGISWCLMLLLQVSFVFLMHNQIRYDAYWVFSQAVEMLDTHEISATLHNAYFTQVPNNYGLTLITYWFLSLVKFFGCPKEGYVTAVQLLNTACIDISLLCIFLSLKKLKGLRPAVFFLLFCVLTPFAYVWTLYYYTSTVSMAFACAAVYLWLCIRHTASQRTACVLAGLLGILCITGFKVRATSLIAYIAIFLFWLLCGSKQAFRQTLKKMLPSLLVFLACACLTFLAWKGIVKHYVPFDTTDTAFPVTHFMMMGAQGDGSYSSIDRLYTISLPTAQAKLQGTVNTILERIREGGLIGTLKLLSAKQLNCWAEGTDLAQYESSLCTEFNFLHPWIIGSKNHYFISFSQMLRVVQLFLVLISCIYAWIRRRADGIFLMALNLLGGMAFHLLWETSPAYSVPFTFFSYALVCDGAEQITASRWFSRKSGAYACLGTVGVLLAATCVALVVNFGPTTSQVREMDDYVVNQHMSDDETSTPVNQIGETWCQTFEAQVPFNVLQLSIHNPSPADNESEYRITLLDEHGTIHYDQPVYGDRTGFDPYYEIGMDLVKPNGLTTYTIRIETLHQTSTEFVRFNCITESMVDVYPHGTLTIDEESARHDLAFRVLQRNLAPLATKKEYCALAILLILLELLLLLGSVRLVKSSRFIH